MTSFLPRDVIEGLEVARKLARGKNSRFRVHAGDRILPLSRVWNDGFALEQGAGTGLRGLVDVYDGTRHLWRCLIVASEDDGHETKFEFKRATAASERAPLDFWQGENAPVGLIARD